eukprot:71315-Alexandrium_andersonii.AAC.1
MPEPVLPLEPPPLFLPLPSCSLLVPLVPVLPLEPLEPPLLFLPSCSEPVLPLDRWASLLPLLPLPLAAASRSPSLSSSSPGDTGGSNEIDHGSSPLISALNRCTCRRFASASLKTTPLRLTSLPRSRSC